MVKDQLRKIAESYYHAMAAKDIAAISRLLDDQIEFKAPLTKTNGKEDFLKAAKGFMMAFEKLTIHASFEEGEKAVVVYDLVCHGEIGNVRSVALFSFEGELISRIELFYDPRPFLG